MATLPVGEQLKYLIYTRQRPIACIAWFSAPRHLGSRDRFLGWSAAARRQNVRLLAYDPRFLILPWVRVPHLASHILGQMAQRLAGDWQRCYGHPIYFLETFVDPQRFRGTCYRAANWILLGRTTGRGNNAPTKKPTFACFGGVPTSILYDNTKLAVARILGGGTRQKTRAFCELQSHHSPYTKGNFEFERVVTGWRGIHTVLDCHLKK